MQACLLFAECEEFERSQNDELYCRRSFAMLFPNKATQWRDVHNRRCRVAKPTDNDATYISPAWGGIMG